MARFGDCQWLCLDIRYGSYDQTAKRYSWSSLHHDYVMALGGLEIITKKYTLQLAHPGPSLALQRHLEKGMITTNSMERPCPSTLHKQSLVTKGKWNDFQALGISYIDGKSHISSKKITHLQAKSGKDCIMSRILRSFYKFSIAGFSCWNKYIYIRQLYATCPTLAGSDG